MERELSIATFTTFARQATYTLPPGDPIDVQVIVNEAVERWGLGSSGASIVEHVDEAEFLVEKIHPRPGATLTMGAKSWTIGNVVENDGYIIIVTLRKINV